MKVSLFVHDLSSNPIVRAYPLGQALRRCGYEVEYLGFLLDDDEVYRPYRDKVDVKALLADRSVADVIPKSFALAQKADGDIIYAFKPLWTSFWPALLASGFGRKKPLLLDVEDNETWGTAFQTRGQAIRAALRGWRTATNSKWSKLLHPATHLAHASTVSSSRLQQIYDGQIVLHGPDSASYHSEELSQRECREELGLPSDGLMILFAGRPHWYKGLDIVVEALQRYEKQPHLVLCGDPENPIFRRAKEQLAERCHLMGYIRNERMPVVLSAVDVVPVLQRKTSYTEAQIPAKLLEAMAMGKVVVGTDVSDLQRLIGGGEDARGWLLKDNSPRSFAQVVRDIASKPRDTAERCQRARSFHLEHASVEANSRKLCSILDDIRATVCK